MAFDFFVADGQGTLTINPMLIHTTAITASDGTFTVDISNAGLTHAYSAYATVLATNNQLSNTISVTISELSTSSVSGVAYQPTTAAPGLLAVTPVGAGQTVNIIILGDIV